MLWNTPIKNIFEGVVGQTVLELLDELMEARRKAIEVLKTEGRRIMRLLDQLKAKQSVVKAVVYARYSSDMQREESIEAQIRAVRDFAEPQRYPDHP